MRTPQQGHGVACMDGAAYVHSRGAEDIVGTIVEEHTRLHEAAGGRAVGHSKAELASAEVGTGNDIHSAALPGEREGMARIVSPAS